MKSHYGVKSNKLNLLSCLLIEHGAYIYMESKDKQANYFADLLGPKLLLPTNITDVTVSFLI